MNTQKLLFLLFALCIFTSAADAQGTRIKLPQLEQGQLVGGTRAGQLGLTNTAGDQRYAHYTSITLAAIAYIPTTTGNTSNLSEFVTDPNGDIWYIDWQGNGQQLTGGGVSCDTDFLQISDNSCPNSLLDSLYKYNYLSIGARYVWPSAELLVTDSSTQAVEVINGARGANLVLYDNINETYSTLQQGGTDFAHYIVPDGVYTWKTAGGGTPEDPDLPFVNHFGINTNDSTIQMYRYPRTRVDTQYVSNFLYTDTNGKIRSKPTSAFPLVGLGGIYGGSGTVNNGTKATLASGATFEFDYNAGGAAIQIVDPLQTTIASGNGSYTITASLSQVDVDAPASNLRVSTGAISGSAATVSFPTSGGVVKIGGGNSASELRFQEPSGSGTNYSGFKAQAQAGNVTYTLPNADGSSGNVLATNGSGTLSWAAAGGSGTVTSFSSGNLSPVFTTSVATATTTPALSFSLDTHTANTVFAGPTSGGAAAPTFRTLVAADIPSSAAGDFFKDGGNTFGAAATLGTNDNNTLSFETNNVTRATVTAGASTGGAWTATDVTANTNTVENILTLRANSTGTAAAAFGTGIVLQGESTTTDNRDMASINANWVTATDATRAAQIEFSTGSSGGALTPFSWLRRTGSSTGEFLLGTSNPVTLRATSMTFGAAFVIGSTAGSNSISISNGSGAVGFVRRPSTTNAPISITFGANSSGTAANGFGPQLLLQGQSSTTADQEMGAIATIWTDVTHATRTADMTFSTVNNAAALAEKMRLTAAGRLGIGDTSPETDLDVTGTTGTGHLIGQDNTPTITVTTAGAGTGATASMVNAQSSDLAGRFSITTGTGSTTGKWCDVSFGTAFATTPIVQVYCEDDDCSILTHYTNVSTTGFEWFVTSASVDSRTYNMSFIIIGGK